MKHCEYHMKRNNNIQCCKLQLLPRVKISGKKTSILPAGIMQCCGRRHIETQSNHTSFWGLRYQLEHIRRSKTTVMSPMLRTMSQGNQISGSGESFKVWVWWPSWSCDQDHI